MQSIFPNRITLPGVALAAVLSIALLAGCGGGGSSTTTATEASSSVEASDALLLDKVLARQEAAVDAYAEVAPTLTTPGLRRMAAYFRAQEQEHVDATIKALRGLGAKAEAEAEPIEVGEPTSDPERLEFLYEVEGATIDEELSAIGKLEASWPRELLASMVGNQSQHRTLLRQALGAGPLASVPEPFENGTAPPPE